MSPATSSLQLFERQFGGVDSRTTLWISASLLSTASAVVWVQRKRKDAYKSLPPSPLKHWFWGNKEVLNQPYRHVRLGTEYKRTLGDIISLTTPVETTIIINTAELATELLDKQAAVTSNRPRSVMVQDLLGWNASTAFRRLHDERHKKLRRVLASALHPSAARSYAPQNLDSTMEFLRRISETPAAFEKHTNDVVGEFILRITYGYRTVENDPVLATVHHSVSYLVKASSSYFLVNDFPILRYFPAWFPGAGFQVLAREGKAMRDRSINDPFNMVFEQVRDGRVESPSYTSRLLESKGGVNASEEDIDLIKLTAGSMFTGGATTTVGTVLSFILMLVLRPELVKVAQAEIDTVVGRERIPELNDRDNMPYMEALLQEVMRMCSVAPLGTPHVTGEDVELRGYRIPKGTSIQPNIWAMLHDPKYYSSPHTFDPTRFLRSTPDLDPRKYMFGFGRRICPGMHIANNSTWIMCAGILAVYNLQPGAELLAKVEALGGPDSEQIYKLFKPSAIYDPLPFSCHFVPRDQAALDLLENSAR